MMTVSSQRGKRFKFKLERVEKLVTEEEAQNSPRERQLAKVPRRTW
jgi:hypothetical protein